MKNSSQRILIISPSWIGDFIMSQSLLIALKEQNYNCIIDIVAPKSTAILAERFPEVNQIFTLDIKHKDFGLRKRIELGKLLKNKYDVAYVLTNSLKSSLVPFFAKIPKRIGWLGESRYILLNNHLGKRDKKKLPLMIHGYLGLLFNGTDKSSLIDSEDKLGKKLVKYHPRITAKEIDDKFAILKDGNSICICPGASYGPAKRWPDFHFAKLAKMLINDGYKVVILGGPDEVELLNKIESEVNNSNLINLAGKSKLLETIDILNIAKVNIANDSGLMHISCALRKKTVAIYGPTSPGYAPPLNNNAEIVSLNYPTEPKLRHSNDHKDGYHRSMLDLKPETVYAAVKNLITSTKNEI